MELAKRHLGVPSTTLWIGGRYVEARRLAVEFHEAAFVLQVSIGEVKRMVRRGELGSGSIDDDRTIDVESLARHIEGLVGDRMLDEMSLVLLREVVTGQRHISAAVVRSRPKRMLREAL
jgi:hypothetical protein